MGNNRKKKVVVKFKREKKKKKTEKRERKHKKKERKEKERKIHVLSIRRMESMRGSFSRRKRAKSLAVVARSFENSYKKKKKIIKMQHCSHLIFFQKKNFLVEFSEVWGGLNTPKHLQTPPNFNQKSGHCFKEVVSEMTKKKGGRG